jgi:hypothetical protein
MNLAAADGGYRKKYRHCASIVDHIERDEPRSAMLLAEPT